MTGLVHVSELLAEWVASLNPEAEVRYRQALCREAYERGYEAGHADGYVECAGDVKAAHQGLYAIFKRHHDVAVNRYRSWCKACRTPVRRPGCRECKPGYLCKDCRIPRPRPNCQDCQDCTPDTWVLPRDDDYTGGRVAWRSSPSGPTTTTRETGSAQ
jgi:hypothetical protein